jgi:hypothetical protein
MGSGNLLYPGDELTVFHKNVTIDTEINRSSPFISWFIA